jgi:acetyltransferase-like isoleucine patch superfamily enzyme
VLPRVRVGAWSIVGAGCTVIRDVPDHATVVGVPGREIRRRPATELR